MLLIPQGLKIPGTRNHRYDLTDAELVETLKVGKPPHPVIEFSDFAIP